MSASRDRCNSSEWLNAAGILFLALSMAPCVAAATEAPAAAPATTSLRSAPSAPAVSPSTDSKSDVAENPTYPTADASGEPIGDETLLLEVRVNGQPTGKIGEFVRRRGRLMVRPSELRDLGFRIPDALILGTQDLIALSDVRGLSWNLDEKNLTLNFHGGR